MIDLTQLANARRQEQRTANDIHPMWQAVDAVLEADDVVWCSQHGFRGTPRCNDNDACFLQTGVFVLITRPGDTEQ